MTDKEISYAEDERNPEDALEWQRDTIRLAYEFIDRMVHEFVPLPGKYDIDEYGIMEILSSLKAFDGQIYLSFRAVKVVDEEK